MIHAADMFCGAGGTSTGLVSACHNLKMRVKLMAVNHWKTAVATHQRNHPWAQHACMDLSSEEASPNKLIPGGKLNILVASPECTHHSVARGGKPMNEQSRASAFHVCHWAERLNIDCILVENVKEFMNWCPLKRIKGKMRPDPAKKGETFRAWVSMLESLGYYHDLQILNCADFGDPTTRKRLFIQFWRRRRPTWPVTSHAPRDIHKLMGKQAWRSAREIIDWDLLGSSIFGRKKDLSPNTINRIKAGLAKFGGEAFLAVLNGTADRQVEISVKDIDGPVPTLTGCGHIAICQPFMVPHSSGNAPRSIDDPLPTLTTTSRAMMLAQGFIVPLTHQGKRRCHPLDEPMPTITGANRGEFALAQPFVVQCNHGNDGAGSVESRAQSVEDPLRAVTGANTHAMVAPGFLVEYHKPKKGEKPRVRSVDEPLGTQTTENRFALCQYLVEYYGNSKKGHSVDKPLPTVTSKSRFGLAAAFLVPNFGERDGQQPRTHDLDEPVPAVTGHGAGCLVQPAVVRGKLDILFRMLQPHELAAATSLQGYEFEGNKTEQVKQIGNAVPKCTAEALCENALGANARRN